MWCSAFTPSAAYELATTDTHTLANYRYIYMKGNRKKFACNKGRGEGEGGGGRGDRPNMYVKEMKFDDSLILCLFVYLFFCFKGYRFSFKYERVL